MSIQIKQASEHHVLIVGGGIGGLACALECAVAGLKVTVLERAPTIGGKLHQVHVNGVGIDSGPTVFTMRWIFDALFEKAGTRLEDELRVHRADVIARHAWGPDERLDLFADADRSAAAIQAFSSAAEADRFLKFCAQARTTYQALEAAYIRSQRPTILSMHNDLGFKGLKVLFDLGMFQSLWRSLSRHFKDPRLHQLFSRYATYCGSSPLMAPATLMLIADVEMQGVCVLDGGMSELAKALARLAEQHGATIRTQADCSQILVKQDRACGVRLASGEDVFADSVVFNGDVAALRNGVVSIIDPGASATRRVRDQGRIAAKAFGPPQDDLPKRSLSALTFSIHAKTHGFPLVHHNLFFNQDYASEFHDIFGRRQLPTKPTVYICAQDRRDHDGPVNGPERLLLLINAPATGDRQSFDSSEIHACTHASFSLLEHCGLSIDRTSENTVVKTPTDFHRFFPATGGALYGQATHGWMSSFARHSSASKIAGLYLAGGSVHPGPGVPMAAMSGRLAAATLMGHLGLIRPSRRVVISGGMSMR
jgi:1-hydroxycarotenoid 3,4-desaturase